MLQVDSDGNGSLSLEELTAALKLNHISDEGIKVTRCDGRSNGTRSNQISGVRITVWRHPSLAGHLHPVR